MKIFYFFFLEFVLTSGALYEEYIERNGENEISADIDDVLKVIGSVFSRKIDDDGEDEK
jgi:hypothetical protein